MGGGVKDLKGLKNHSSPSLSGFKSQDGFCIIVFELPVMRAPADACSRSLSLPGAGRPALEGLVPLPELERAPRNGSDPAGPRPRSALLFRAVPLAARGYERLPASDAAIADPPRRRSSPPPLSSQTSGAAAGPDCDSLKSGDPALNWGRIKKK